MTEVAILVAAYNAAATLPRCLESLCSQRLRDIQILCVDDCSTDDTLSLLRKQAQKDSRIEVLQTPVNSGHAVARNLALQHVCAKYVCMVDADDWLSDDALESAVGVFRAKPQTDCVMFRLHQLYDSGIEEDYGLPPQLESGGCLTGQHAFELSLDGWRLHGLYLIRTSIHQCYPLDTSTRLYSDDNTYRLMFLHCREVRACSGIYYYRKHAASQTVAFHLGRFDFMEANLSMLFSLRKEGVAPSVLRRFEGNRWMTFLACYRLYLKHRQELTPAQQAEVQQRLRTILHTFRPSHLPLRYRWKPGYWLMFSPAAFHLQQWAYVRWWEESLRARMCK